MQMIEAVIKPHKLDAVKTALAKLGILGVTAVECKGFGRQMGHTERYRGAKLDVGFVPKILLKICVRSDESAKAVDTIVEAARTGEVGDGKIFVYPIAEVIRIKVEVQLHVAEPKQTRRAHILQAWNSVQRSFDRNRDLLFHLLG